MRRRDTYWSLFHTPEKRQINDLRTDHVEAIFEAVPTIHHKDWVIWREGFRSWKPFADFPQLIQSLRQLAGPESAKPEPPPKEVIERVQAEAAPNAIRKFEDKIDTISLELKADGDLAERETRYPKQWEIMIHGNSQKVTAKTKDVSINGLQLSESITLSLPRYFTVEILGPGATFNVVCSAIRSFDMQPCSRLKIEVNEQKAAYTAAIMSK